MGYWSWNPLIYRYRWGVKCVSVLTPPIPPRGTPSVAGVDTLYPPTFVTCGEILNIRKKPWFAFLEKKMGEFQGGRESRE